MFPENWHFNSRFVLKTTKIPVFVFFTEILWQTFWRNKWWSIFDDVKRLRLWVIRVSLGEKWADVDYGLSLMAKPWESKMCFKMIENVVKLWSGVILKFFDRNSTTFITAPYCKLTSCFSSLLVCKCMVHIWDSHILSVDSSNYRKITDWVFLRPRHFPHN